MTPKEKARQLIDKMRYEIYHDVITSANVDLKREAYRDNKAKQCALIAVEEILTSELTAYPNQYIGVGQVFTEYWQSVKEEIQIL